ncbi:MAG: hypothetical protein LBV30_04725 [Propionibacteriaceae bacterium]|jgi:hypothetical protein|nr:hypothetical protein [Propionibacteriaceae bacterium]
MTQPTNWLMPLAISIDWWALLQVAVVTVVASAAIATLMSLANWFFTPRGEADKPSRPREVAGSIMIGLTALIVLYGLYLLIPYFHH